MPCHKVSSLEPIEEGRCGVFRRLALFTCRESVDLFRERDDVQRIGGVPPRILRLVLTCDSRGIDA